jgi:hypothetical protein
MVVVAATTAGAMVAATTAGAMEGEFVPLLLCRQSSCTTAVRSLSCCQALHKCSFQGQWYDTFHLFCRLQGRIWRLPWLRLQGRV